MAAEQYFQSRITRRNLLGGIAGLATLRLVGCSEGSGEFRKSNAATTIRTLEQQIGNNKLTFEQARELIPHMTRLYTDSLTSNRTRTEIEKNIFILDSRPPYFPDLKRIDYETVYKSGWHRDLLTKYPHLQLSHEDIVQLTQVNWYGSYAGLYNNEKMFIFLLGLNEENGTGLGTPYHQFQKIESPTQCQPSTPAVRFTSTVLHEIAHGELKIGSKPLDATALQVLQKVFKKSHGINIQGAKVSGFWVDLQSNDSTHVAPIVSLEELFADYVATRISVANGLDYSSLASSQPNDIKNLMVILNQAQITDTVFLHAHQNSGIEYILYKIGDAAKPLTINRYSHLEIAMNLLLSLGDWEIYSKYFPKVDPTLYQFYPTADKQAKKAYSGCTNQNYLN